MIIVKYENDNEVDGIIGAKTAEGYTLTNVNNVVEGKFLGFMKLPDLDYIKNDGKREIATVLNDAFGLFELKSEIIQYLKVNGIELEEDDGQ